MFDEMQLDIFGGRAPTGNGNLTDLLRKFLAEGYPPEVCRMLALFHYEPIKAMLWDISENTFGLDELENIILNVSKSHHGVIETLARAKRQMMHERKGLARQAIRADRSREWYKLYLSTSHWSDVCERAAQRKFADACVLSHEHPRQEWHHPTYAYIGQGRDADVIVPVCIDCHNSYHSWHKVSFPVTMPRAVQRVLESENLI